MDSRFAGRHVLITGAAGGMGLAFARKFAEEGATLILTDVQEPGLEKSASVLRDLGITCSTHAVDLSTEAAISTFAAEICRLHPRLDVLINNAGIAYGEIS